MSKMLGPSGITATSPPGATGLMRSSMPGSPTVSLPILHSFGWRIGVAIAGILIVLLVMLIAKRLFASTLLAVIAGTLMAIDGHAIVLSRVSLLDNFVTLFTLAGFGLILLDRQRNLPRLQAWIAHKRAGLSEADDGPTWGPTMWGRPYLIVAGLAFGLACSVKSS
ncbi:MAG: hypothetical protein RLZZ52_1328 [Actinomycetota bacterium]